jgi:hypothetical protein
MFQDRLPTKRFFGPSSEAVSVLVFLVEVSSSSSALRFLLGFSSSVDSSSESEESESEESSDFFSSEASSSESEESESEDSCYILDLVHDTNVIE